MYKLKSTQKITFISERAGNRGKKYFKINIGSLNLLFYCKYKSEFVFIYYTYILEGRKKNERVICKFSKNVNK